MATKRRSNALATFAIAWAILAVAGYLTYYLVNGTVWLVFAILASLISGGIAVHRYRKEGRLLREHNHRAIPPTYAGPPSYRSRRQRARAKRLAVSQGKVRSGWTRMGRVKTCNASCRDSRLPSRFCRCPCGGKNHGELRRAGIQMKALLQQPIEAVKPKPKREPPKRKPPVRKPVRRTTQPTQHTATPKPRSDRPRREVKIPRGNPTDPVVMVWRNDGGQPVTVRSTIATATILKNRGRLIDCRRPE